MRDALLKLRRLRRRCPNCYYFVVSSEMKRRASKKRDGIDPSIRVILLPTGFDSVVEQKS
jgi:hypothetical protein